MALIVTAATTVASYLGITSSAAALTTTLTPIIATAASKAAQLAIIYGTGKLLRWSCEDAVKFNEEHCLKIINGTTEFDTSIACLAMKTNELVSCVGSTTANLVLAGNVLVDAGELFKKVKK